jgi:hypothetical protein
LIGESLVKIFWNIIKLLAPLALIAAIYNGCGTGEDIESAPYSHETDPYGPYSPYDPYPYDPYDPYPCDPYDGCDPYGPYDPYEYAAPVSADSLDY